jgi:hypothetical protein
MRFGLSFREVEFWECWEAFCDTPLLYFLKIVLGLNEEIFERYDTLDVFWRHTGQIINLGWSPLHVFLLYFIFSHKIRNSLLL